MIVFLIDHNFEGNALRLRAILQTAGWPELVPMRWLTCTNMEIIALLAIHLNSGIKVPKRLVKAAADALNRELAEEELSSWSEPDKRKQGAGRDVRPSFPLVGDCLPLIELSSR